MSLDNGLTFIETLSNPFQGGILEPVGAARASRRSWAQTVTFFDPNPKSPRMQRWQVGMQRELPGTGSPKSRYVGNYGSQIQTTRNLNATPQPVSEHEPDARSGDDRLPERAPCRTRSSG